MGLDDYRLRLSEIRRPFTKHVLHMKYEQPFTDKMRVDIVDLRRLLLLLPVENIHLGARHYRKTTCPVMPYFHVTIVALRSFLVYSNG